MLRHLDSPEGRLFSEWLEGIRLREYKKLMEEKEIELVYRSQGSVGIIDLIRSLKEDLRDYQKDVREGRCSPLKEE
jgi:hypothetical protein